MALTGKQPGVDNGSWPTQTLRWGGGSITVTRRTVGHSKTAQRIVAQLPVAEDMIEQLNQRSFARLASQTVEIEGLDISFPALGDGQEAWLQAYDDFQTWDDPLVNLWYQAIDDVDRPYGPRELLPTSHLLEEEQKNSPSAESS
ncbi:MAG TPA: hypothetical protein VK972_00820 [Wenzhouxiangella sp.]|nr:hypothetical protein [Wenzhouxiangella sp.]